MTHDHIFGSVCRGILLVARFQQRTLVTIHGDHRARAGQQSLEHVKSACTNCMPIAKRLARGRFQRPMHSEAPKVTRRDGHTGDGHFEERAARMGLTRVDLKAPMAKPRRRPKVEESRVVVGGAPREYSAIYADAGRKHRVSEFDERLYHPATGAIGEGMIRASQLLEYVDVRVDESGNFVGLEVVQPVAPRIHLPAIAIPSAVLPMWMDVELDFVPLPRKLFDVPAK